MPHICHVSILNPLRHTRVYHKLARSQARMGYRVSVIAQGRGDMQTDDLGIRLLPRREFSRTSWRRWFSNLLMLRVTLRMKADAYVLHTPELLPLGFLLKRILRTKILYDVHEDYAANLRYGAHWSARYRGLLARMVRAFERLAVRYWVDGVCYAEACYDNQLRALPQQKLILENVFVAPQDSPQLPSLPPQPYLLYSGTIAQANGIFDAIELWRRWQEVEPIHLVVAGHTQHPSLLTTIQTRISRTGFADRFTLIGGNTYVPYADMVALIEGCYAGLSLYQDLPQIRGKMPTKFFEYMACKKPLIFSPQPAWMIRNTSIPFGLPWRLGDDVPPLVAATKQWRDPNLEPRAYTWAAQESRLAYWISKILPGNEVVLRGAEVHG